MNHLIKWTFTHWVFRMRDISLENVHWEFQGRVCQVINEDIAGAMDNVITSTLYVHCKNTIFNSTLPWQVLDKGAHTSPHRLGFLFSSGLLGYHKAGFSDSSVPSLFSTIRWDRVGDHYSDIHLLLLPGSWFPCWLAEYKQYVHSHIDINRQLQFSPHWSKRGWRHRAWSVVVWKTELNKQTKTTITDIQTMTTEYRCKDIEMKQQLCQWVEAGTLERTA